MSSIRHLLPLLAVTLAPLAGLAHESYLPLHHHDADHDHGAPAAAHEPHGVSDGKHHHPHLTPEAPEHRFAFATGARFTRYSLDGEAAHLWETGLGVEVALGSWVRVGGDVSYGWFDSEEGNAEGLLAPHAHLDLHIPLGRGWELIAGFDAGFPGGEEALVGRHWELTPHAELRYDRGSWFAEAAAGLVFVLEEGEHAHGAAEETHEDHAEDFEEIVEPHGERELKYSAAFGVRLLEQRLTLAARLAGVHVLAGDTPADNYLRAGLRAAWVLREGLLLSAESSVPITKAERNEWQTSLGLRISF